PRPGAPRPRAEGHRHLSPLLSPAQSRNEEAGLGGPQAGAVGPRPEGAGPVVVRCRKRRLARAIHVLAGRGVARGITVTPPQGGGYHPARPGRRSVVSPTC